VIIGRFVVNLVVMVTLGFWEANVPVFISTIAMGLGVSGAMIASWSGLVAELKRREDG
jgi:hypothetical protein